MTKQHWAHKLLTKRINEMKYGSKIPKFLRLPTPVELGKAKYNALPMEGFGAKENDYTWSAWRNEMKQDYPIKYFIYETFTTWFRRKITKPISDFKYYIVSHTIRKYHMLDMRNKENDYAFGWIDCDAQLLYASMAIMENFIIEQDTPSRLIWLKEELVKDPNCEEFNWNDKIKFCEDLLAIQKWWRVERPKNTELSFSGPEYGLDFDEKCRKEDDDMMKKLIDIRAGMWT
jgi:hypothetical protein